MVGIQNLTSEICNINWQEAIYIDDKLFMPDANISLMNDEAIKVKRCIDEGNYYLHLSFSLTEILAFLFEPRRSKEIVYTKIIFREDVIWSYELEELFNKKCIMNPACAFDFDLISKIYESYNNLFPQWHLKRYYTRSIRLLDHIHNCQVKNTVKEILYKAGLDELAENSDNIDEINLLSTRPAEIYDGLTNRTLKSLNCKFGADFLTSKKHRLFLRELQNAYPDTFSEKLNDAQCRYLQYLIDGDLTVGEAGRLFNVRKKDLQAFWSDYQYRDFINSIKLESTVNTVRDIDPIYRTEIEKNDYGSLRTLYEYLVVNKDKHNDMIRRLNRKKDMSWQERDCEYIVRYPQTVNDFCREAIYQHNCLLTYFYPWLHGDTNILFMREKNNVNMPFITIEIFDNRLIQAYHRFNKNCSEEEEFFINDYCKRHGIENDTFTFGRHIDRLF